MIVDAKRLKHIYGPVPSRRLGRSLGIDLVPLKTCTYDCIYCHLGETTNKTLDRKEYASVNAILSELEQRLAVTKAFDYISLAGSGEPTLNSGIGDLIPKIKSMTNIPLAILTNGSLLWINDIQESLMQADLVIPSLDAGDKDIFRYVNRPHKDISFEQMVDGLIGFTNRYKGDVWLEILLLAGVTSIPEEVKKIASIVKSARFTRIQLNTVIRPPSKAFAKPVARDQMLKLKSILPGKVEIIGDSQDETWSKLPDSYAARHDVLSLIARRPCTDTEIASSLGLNISEVFKHLDALKLAGKIVAVRMNDKSFYAMKESADALRY
jgi:wyosine [tRNA(Phe)-imidazoG37] synthetase (radical SAM superfamily)